MRPLDKGEHGVRGGIDIGQGACADASMLALALIDKALPAYGIVGGPVIWCHDEIVLEVREEDGERAATLLKQTMTRTFEQVFPGRRSLGWSRCMPAIPGATPNNPFLACVALA